MNITVTSPSPELTRLEILRAYKEHLVRQADVNVSPFVERVVGYDSKVHDLDVPEIHSEVRDLITQIIQGIHQGYPSQVVILAGDPGMGKSHLINHFRHHQQTEALGCIVVCNSNHWRSNEFESCLLDWLLAALVRPSPNGPHLLLDKIQDVAFEALRQILEQPGQLRRFDKPSRFWQRVWRKLNPHHERWQQRMLARDVRVFRELNFPRFASYVCDRFLYDGGNPFHRQVLHILLRYLFEDERERILHWLRGKKVDFAGATGVEEQIDANYKVIDAIKILISLFTPEVSRNLGTGDSSRGRGKIIFFAFDQMEGRQELFENDSDWRKFFAQLSEMYNTLPNVFILFTMTLALRQRLYPQMEAQFRDRIRRDEELSLRQIKASEVLALYRHRVQHWLGVERANLLELLAGLDEPYLPFRQDEVLQFAGQSTTLRDKLDHLDEAFRNYFKILITEPHIDYFGFRNEFHQQEEASRRTEYVANHLDQAKKLFDHIKELLEADNAPLLDTMRVVLTRIEWRATDDKLPALCLEFRHALNPAARLRVFLVYLPHHFKQYVDGCLALLYKQRIGGNFLWLVRAARIDADLEAWRPGQIHARVLPGATHTVVQALVRLLDNRAQYKPEEQQVVDTLLGEELAPTYLGELLRKVREILESKQGAPVVEEESDLDEVVDSSRSAEQEQGP